MRWDDRTVVVVPDPVLAVAVADARAMVAPVRGAGVDAAIARVPGDLRMALRLCIRDPEDERISRILGAARSRIGPDGMVQGEHGPDPEATGVLGACELRQGDPRCWDRIDALALAVGSPDGLGERAATVLLPLLGRALVADDGETLEVLTILPDAWFGEHARVEHLGLGGGAAISWQLDWPEGWPQLTWATSAPGRSIRSRGIDPQWASTRPRGTHAVGEIVSSVGFEPGEA